MEIKLIALDMDGTLLDADHATVPERNIAALRAASERGAAVTIASGRAWRLLTDVAAQLGVARYAILANGACVLDIQTGEWLYQKGLPRAQYEAVVDYLLAGGYPFEVYCEGDIYVPADRVEQVRKYVFTPEFLEVFDSNSIAVADMNAALAGKVVEKLHIFRVPEGERETLLRAAGSAGPIEATSSTPTNMELTAAGVNKGTALSALCGRLGIPAQAVLACGDAANDVEMLAWAGYSFAMANATPEAIAAARYRTASNTEAGVAQAVERCCRPGGTSSPLDTE